MNTWKSFLCAPDQHIYIDNSKYMFGLHAPLSSAFLTCCMFESFTNFAIGISGFPNTVMLNSKQNPISDFYKHCKEVRSICDMEFKKNPQMLYADLVDLPNNDRLALRFFYVHFRGKLYSFEHLMKFATFTEFFDSCNQLNSLTNQCLAKMPLDVQQSCKIKGPGEIYNVKWAWSVVLCGYFGVEKIPVQDLLGIFQDDENYLIRYDWFDAMGWWCEVNLKLKHIRGRSIPFDACVVDEYESSDYSVIRWQSKFNASFWAKVVVFKDYKQAMVQRLLPNPEVLATKK